ncbi:cation:proton antiporter [Salinibacter sp. 10B]|uniref:Na+/H+ antiporter subunit C n=1 Tax=Salinibacter sp. 10B TaxID=1923971 RepID=UPI000CF4C42A|nr:Na+/H+ antiporter subunit C [Salinibacter sp. 10B]PQJ35969.1 cation:proton antiporter [Salinibacter sp. 10B]
MELIISVVSGVLLAASFYLLMRRNLLRFVIGVIILGNGVNLLIFTMGRLTRAEPPVIPKGQKVLEGAYANPLPQALILTAIVISFGLLAFTLVLVYRNFAANETIQSDEVRGSEPTDTLDVHEESKRLPA